MTILKSIMLILENIIRNKHDVLDWVTKSSMPNSDYGNLIPKLVITLLLAHMNDGRNHSQVMEQLSKNIIVQDLPVNFFERLQQATILKEGQRNQFLRILSDALAAVENPLVVICSQESCSEFSILNAFVIRSEELRCRENVITKLFHKNSGNIWQKEEPSSRNSTGCNRTYVICSQEVDSESTSISTISLMKNQGLESGTRKDDKDINNISRHFWREFEAFQLENQDQVSQQCGLMIFAIFFWNLIQRFHIHRYGIQLLMYVYMHVLFYLQLQDIFGFLVALS